MINYFQNIFFFKKKEAIVELPHNNQILSKKNIAKMISSFAINLRAPINFSLNCNSIISGAFVLKLKNWKLKATEATYKGAKLKKQKMTQKLRVRTMFHTGLEKKRLILFIYYIILI